MPRKKKKLGRKPSNIPKSSLNTTIRTDVFNPFRDKCKKMGKPMGYILEMFMEGFVEGRYKIGIVESSQDKETEH